MRFVGIKFSDIDDDDNRVRDSESADHNTTRVAGTVLKSWSDLTVSALPGQSDGMNSFDSSAAYKVGRVGPGPIRND